MSTDQIQRIFRLSLPMAASRFLQMLSGFFGTMMVSHLGHVQLASCALIGATLSPILLVLMSIVFSLSFITGQYAGAKKYDDIGALVQQGALLSFLLALVMLICFACVPSVLRWCHQQPIMIVYVAQYFHALMWGAIPIMMQSCLEQFFYGVLKQRWVIVTNTLSLLIGVPIAYTLIFGKFGFPALGVGGLGLTFAIQAWFGFSLLFIFSLVLNDFKQFALFKKHTHTGWLHLKKIIHIGWPMGVQFGGELGSFFVITLMIGWLGTDALAAVQVTQQWMYLVVVPVYAMSEASGILVGQAVGAKDYAKLFPISHVSLLLSLGLMFVLGVGFSVFPDFFASFYLNIHLAKNQDILGLVQMLFPIMSLTLILTSLRDVLTGALRGLFDTKFPMQIGILVMWGLVIPLGYLFAFPLHMDVVGFKMGGNIGLLVGAMLIYWRWNQKVNLLKK